MNGLGCRSEWISRVIINIDALRRFIIDAFNQKLHVTVVAGIVSQNLNHVGPVGCSRNRSVPPALRIVGFLETIHRLKLLRSSDPDVSPTLSETMPQQRGIRP